MILTDIRHELADLKWQSVPKNLSVDSASRILPRVGWNLCVCYRANIWTLLTIYSSNQFSISSNPLVDICGGLPKVTLFALNVYLYFNYACFG